MMPFHIVYRRIMKIMVDLVEIPSGEMISDNVEAKEK